MGKMASLISCGLNPFFAIGSQYLRGASVGVDDGIGYPEGSRWQVGCLTAAE
jgi:hypothetical protein